MSAARSGNAFRIFKQTGVRRKICGDWLITGDLGHMDEEGILVSGRVDDVITSSGYRIGPSG